MNKEEKRSQCNYAVVEVLLNSESFYGWFNSQSMNILGKILYWVLVIGLGFINPLITFGMIILYYLPRIIEDITKEKPTKRDEYSEQVLDEMK